MVTANTGRLTPIRVPQVTPFTYRDGITYLELLNELSEYIKEVLPESMQKVLDDIVSDAQAIIDAQGYLYIEGVEEFQRIHDAFMADVNANIQALNDTGVADLVEDHGTALYQALAAGFVEIDTLDRRTADNMKNTDTLTGTEHQAVKDSVSANTTLINKVSDDLTTEIETVSTELIKRPLHYGAIGDGVTDDTDALQQFLDDGNVVFDGGRYRITKGLVMTRDHVTLEGNGTTLLPSRDDTTPITALTINGDHATVKNFIIDGQHTDLTSAINGVGYVTEGIRVNGDHATIENNVLQNLFSPQDTRTIRVDGYGGYTITGNTIRNVGTTLIWGDPRVVGENPVSRGIQFNFLGDAQTWSTVSNNAIRNIVGSGSAGIAILNHHGSFPHDTGFVDIIGNTITNVERRGIKIQAEYCNIKNNTIMDYNQARSEYAAPDIDIQNVSNIHVSGNNISGAKSDAIHAVGSSVDGGCERIEIVDNVITMKRDSERTGIYMDYTTLFTIHGNVVTGGLHGIRVGAVSFGAISNNTMLAQHQSGVAIRSTSNNQRLTIVNNVDANRYREGLSFDIMGEAVINENNHSNAVQVI